MSKICTPPDAAVLLALLVKKEEEFGREFSHACISGEILVSITGLYSFDAEFLSDLNECLLDYDLILVEIHNALFGLLRASKVLGWHRIKIDRITEEIEKYRKRQLKLSDISDELLGYFFRDKDTKVIVDTDKNK